MHSCRNYSEVVPCHYQEIEKKKSYMVTLDDGVMPKTLKRGSYQSY